MDSLGPSSNTKSVWGKMLSAGVNGFRLNTSHLSQAQLSMWLDKLLPFMAAHGLSLVIDLQGSKWRLGNFQPFHLTKGQQIDLVLAGETTRANILPVPHPDFFRALLQMVQSPGARGQNCIYLDDAKITLLVDSASHEKVSVRIIRGGEIASRKGIAVSGSVYRVESLNAFDRLVIMATRNITNVQYAISYVKDAVEMANYRALLGSSAYLIAKLERRSAIQEADKIARHANQQWLCRGDLGAELGLTALPEQVYQFSSNLGAITTGVLMAGQILEHMSEHPTPTRSEVCYLYNILVQGYEGIVLSDETAIGRYPVESCQAAALFKQALPRTSRGISAKYGSRR